MREEVLRIEHIMSIQGGMRALDGCSLSVARASVLGVFINNSYKRGALLDILTGARPFDSGRIYLLDERLDQEAYARLAKQRVACVGAHNQLIDDLSVAENIFVMRSGSKKYFLANSTLNDQASRLLQRFSLGIRPDDRALSLTPLKRAAVELIKAAATGAKLVILYDLSRLLSVTEMEAFFDVVKVFKAEGLAFLAIDPYLDVLIKCSDELALLNEGRVIYTFRRGAIDERVITGMLNQPPKRYPAIAAGRPVLEFSHVCSGALTDVSFRLGAGEIISVLDMDGTTLPDMLSILVGEARPSAGTVFLGGARYQPGNVKRAIARGICVLPENPAERTLFRDMDAFQNLVLPSSGKVRGFWYKRRYRRSLKRLLTEMLGGEIVNCQDVRTLDAEALTRIAYTKWLIYAPRVLVLEKPFSAADPSLRHIIQDLIRSFAEHGIAVLALTTNRSEAQMVSGRVLLLSGGKLAEI